MPSPSRGDGPAVMPKYQRIAAALRQELERTARAPGARLPSERVLAARYQVNRQTVRAALQHLREDGLIVTGRRGTRPVTAGPPTTGPERETAHATPDVSGAPGTPEAPSQNWLTHVTVAPSLAALLSMRGGDRTLVHHHRALGPRGEVLHHAVTYLCPAVVAATPELAGYLDRAATAVRDEDLRPLHRWLERAATTARTAETITMTRTTHPSASRPAGNPACGLSVRRTLHDPTGRLLTVTDLAYPTWDRLTFHRDLPAPGFLIT
ncbi:GntR family transcriptional regulator [Streptomyces sp. NBC_00536]|uniref:GntR family transcriptional regulator n=1 Tax=Streptomyces sp. NBC_00536 TaxID=2975769 RepID=UPI002E7FC639|nr:GntR family transcriptional regulator [Streptomyces sp. NBC_00536]WUC82817.1 GntR family transcriptional regulator [Streptomyces sp. NBC_00536]